MKLCCRLVMKKLGYGTLHHTQCIARPLGLLFISEPVFVDAIQSRTWDYMMAVKSKILKGRLRRGNAV
jgi:uncharacterized protein (DUF2461 family)